jgi:D-arabinose 1-dehydrogenase-like Zn-dependent alcohol dehydrogenase
MVWREFEPKPWEDTDADIKASYCGICGIDLHSSQQLVADQISVLVSYVRDELVINHVMEGSITEGSGESMGGWSRRQRSFHC